MAKIVNNPVGGLPNKDPRQKLFESTLEIAPTQADLEIAQMRKKFIPEDPELKKSLDKTIPNWDYTKTFPTTKNPYESYDRKINGIIQKVNNNTATEREKSLLNLHFQKEKEYQKRQLIKGINIPDLGTSLLTTWDSDFKEAVVKPYSEREVANIKGYYGDFATSEIVTKRLNNIPKANTLNSDIKYKLQLIPQLYNEGNSEALFGIYDSIKTQLAENTEVFNYTAPQKTLKLIYEKASAAKARNTVKNLVTNGKQRQADDLVVKMAKDAIKSNQKFNKTQLDNVLIGVSQSGAQYKFSEIPQNGPLGEEDYITVRPYNNEKFSQLVRQHLNQEVKDEQTFYNDYINGKKDKDAVIAGAEILSNAPGDLYSKRALEAFMQDFQFAKDSEHTKTASIALDAEYAFKNALKSDLAYNLLQTRKQLSSLSLNKINQLEEYEAANEAAKKLNKPLLPKLETKQLDEQIQELKTQIQGQVRTLNNIESYSPEKNLKDKYPALYEEMRLHDYETMQRNSLGYTAPEFMTKLGLSLKQAGKSIYDRFVNRDWSGNITGALLQDDELDKAKRYLYLSNKKYNSEGYTIGVDDKGNPVKSGQFFWVGKEGDFHFNSFAIVETGVPVTEQMIETIVLAELGGPILRAGSSMIGAAVADIAATSRLSTLGKLASEDIISALSLDADKIAKLSSAVNKTKNYVLSPTLNSRLLTIGSVMATTYPSIYAEEYKNFKDPMDARNVALLRSLVEGISESYVPNTFDVFQKGTGRLFGLKAGFNRQITDAFEGTTKKLFPGVSNRFLRKFVDSRYMGKAAKVGRVAAAKTKDLIQEAWVEEEAALIFNSFVDRIAAQKDASYIPQNELTVENILKTAIESTAGMALTLPFLGGGSARNQNHNIAAARWNIASNPDAFKSFVASQYEAGKITREEFGNRMANIDVVAQELKDLPININSVRNLSNLLEDKDAQLEYFTNYLDKKALLNHVPTEEQREEYDKALETIDKKLYKTEKLAGAYDNLTTEDKNRIINQNYQDKYKKVMSHEDLSPIQLHMLILQQEKDLEENPDLYAASARGYLNELKNSLWYVRSNFMSFIENNNENLTFEQLDYKLNDLLVPNKVFIPENEFNLAVKNLTRNMSRSLGPVETIEDENEYVEALARNYVTSSTKQVPLTKNGKPLLVQLREDYVNNRLFDRFVEGLPKEEKEAKLEYLKEKFLSRVVELKENLTPEQTFPEVPTAEETIKAQEKKEQAKPQPVLTENVVEKYRDLYDKYRTAQETQNQEDVDNYQTVVAATITKVGTVEELLGELTAAKPFFPNLNVDKIIEDLQNGDTTSFEKFLTSRGLKREASKVKDKFFPKVEGELSEEGKKPAEARADIERIVDAFQPEDNFKSPVDQWGIYTNENGQPIKPEIYVVIKGNNYTKEELLDIEDPENPAVQETLNEIDRLQKLLDAELDALEGTQPTTEVETREETPEGAPVTEEVIELKEQSSEEDEEQENRLKVTQAKSRQEYLEQDRPNQVYLGITDTGKEGTRLDDPYVSFVYALIDRIQESVAEADLKALDYHLLMKSDKDILAKIGISPDYIEDYESFRAQFIVDDIPVMSEGQIEFYHKNFDKFGTFKIGLITDKNQNPLYFDNQGNEVDEGTPMVVNIGQPGDSLGKKLDTQFKNSIPEEGQFVILSSFINGASVGREKINKKDVNKLRLIIGQNEIETLPSGKIFELFKGVVYLPTGNPEFPYVSTYTPQVTEEVAKNVLSLVKAYNEMTKNPEASNLPEYFKEMSLEEFYTYLKNYIYIPDDSKENDWGMVQVRRGGVRNHVKFYKRIDGKKATVTLSEEEIIDLLTGNNSPKGKTYAGIPKEYFNEGKTFRPFSLVNGEIKVEPSTNYRLWFISRSEADKYSPTRPNRNLAFYKEDVVTLSKTTATPAKAPVTTEKSIRIGNLQITQTVNSMGNVEREIKNLDNGKSLLNVITPDGKSMFFSLPNLNAAISNTSKAVKEVIGDIDINKELAALQAPSVTTDAKPKIDLSREWSGDLESRPVYTPEGVNTMRTKSAKSNEHFGNPWSEGGYAGTIKTSSVPEAAQNYKDWLLGNKFQDVKPEQRAWILDQINQGKLDGANLLYSKKLMDRGKGSHANSLADVVEQLRSKPSVSTDAKTDIERRKKEIEDFRTEAKEDISSSVLGTKGQRWGTVIRVHKKENTNISKQYKLTDFESKELLEKEIDKIYDAELDALEAKPEVRVQTNSGNITIKADGSMFYDNGNEVTEEVVKNKALAKKEQQEGTLRRATYNKSQYAILSDNRIISLNESSAGKEVYKTGPQREQILSSISPVIKPEVKEEVKEELPVAESKNAIVDTLEKLISEKPQTYTPQKGDKLSFTYFGKDYVGEFIRFNSDNDYVFEIVGEGQKEFINSKVSNLIKFSPRKRREDTLGGDALERAKYLGNYVDEAQRKEAERWVNNEGRKMFGEDTFILKQTILHPTAYATWSSAGITLYEDSNYADAYHEAWHEFTQMYLTPDERKSLYESSRKIYGNLSDIDIEEKQAEDFRQYRLTGVMPESIKRYKASRTIFQKIMDFLTNLVTNKKTLDKYFMNLSKGKIGKKVGLPQFDILYSAKKLRFFEDGKKVELSFSQTNDYMKLMDELFIYVAQEKAKSMVKDPNQKASYLNLLYNPENIKKIYSLVYNHLFDLEEEASFRGDNLVAAEINKIFGPEDKNFDTLTSFHNRYSNIFTKEMRVNTREYELEDDTNTPEGVSTESKEDQQENGKFFENRSISEISQLELAPPIIINMVKSLPLVQNGEIVYNSLTGVPVLGEFETNWNVLKNTLEGTPTYEQMLDKIEDLSKDYPQFKFLLDILPTEIRGFADQEIHNKFFNLFSMERITGVIGKFNQEGKFTVNNSSSLDVKGVKDNWLVNFNSLRDDRFKELSSVNGNFKLKPTALFSEFPEAPKTGEDMLAFLSAIGFRYSQKSQEQFLKEEGKLRSPVDYIYHKLRSFSQSVDEEIFDPFYAISNKHTYQEDGYPKNYPGQSRYLNSLVQIEVDNNPAYANDMVMAADGTKQWMMNTPTYQTRIADALNDSTVEYFEDLIVKYPELNPNLNWGLKDSYTIFGYLFDFNTDIKVGKKIKHGRRRTENKINTIEVVNMQGIQADLENVMNKKTIDLSDAEKHLADIRTLLNPYGRTEENNRIADKATTRGLRYVDERNFLFDPKTFIRTDTQNQTVFQPKSEVWDIIYNYIRAEVAATNKPSKSKVFENNKYFNSVPQLSYFSQILDDDLKTRIYRSLTDNPNQSNEDFPYKSEIRQQFLDWMRALVNVSKNSILPKLKQSVLTEKTDFVASEADLFRYHFISFIHRVEQFKLFNYHPYYYKNAKDVEKRIAGANATGLYPVLDEQNINFTESRLKGQDAFNSYADKKQIKVLPRNGGPKDFTYLVFKDTPVDSITAKENEKDYRESGNYEFYADREKQADVQDAASILTLDFYKKFYSMAKGLPKDVSMEIDRQEKIWDNLLLVKANPKNAEGIQAKKRLKELLNEGPHYIFSVKKLQYYGPGYALGEAMPIFHKYSNKTILPSEVVDNEQTFNILVKLYSSQADYGVFKTGTKISETVDPVDLYKEDGVSIDTTPVSAAVASLKFLKEQQQVEHKEEALIIFATQFRKLLFRDLTTKEEKKLFEVYKKYVEALVDYDRQNFLKNIEDKELAVEFLIKALSKKNIDALTLDLIKYNKGTGELQNTMDSILNRVVAESAVMSELKKSIIRQKFNGSQFVQFPVSVLRPGKKLKFYRKANGKILPAEAIIAFSPKYYSLLNLPYDKNTTIGELDKDGKPINRYEALKRLNKKLSEPLFREKYKDSLNLAGVRIPVQGYNSMEHMQIVEFLPEESGDIILVPDELVVKSGGDFDIDKLFMYEPILRNGTPLSMTNSDTAELDKLSKAKTKEELEQLAELGKTTVEELKKKYGYEELEKIVDESKDSKELFKKAAEEEKRKIIQNNLLKVIKDRLSQEEIFGDLIEPNNIKNIEEAAKEAPAYLKDNIFKKTTVGGKQIWSNIVNPIYQLYVYQLAHIVDMVGIGAKANTFLTTAQDAKLDIISFRHTSKIFLDVHRNEKGEIELWHVYDVDNNNKIGAIVSETISGSVDVIKDDSILLVNFTPETLPVALYLNNMGARFKDIKKFLSDELIYRYNKGESFEDLINSVEDIDSFIVTNLYGEFSEAGTIEKINKAIIKKDFLTDETALGSVKRLANFILLKRQVSDYVTPLIQRVDYDTFRPQNFEQVRRDNRDLIEIKKAKFYNESGLTKVVKMSAVSPFEITEDVINKFTDIFPLSAQKAVTDYIISAYNAGPKKKRVPYETVSRVFKNELITAIWQTYHPEVNDYVQYMEIGNPENIVEKYNELKVQAREAGIIVPLLDSIYFTSKTNSRYVSPGMTRDDSGYDVNVWKEQFNNNLNYVAPTGVKVPIGFEEDVREFFKILGYTGIISTQLSKTYSSFLPIIPEQFFTPKVNNAVKDIGKKSTMLQQKGEELSVKLAEEVKALKKANQDTQEALDDLRLKYQQELSSFKTKNQIVFLDKFYERFKNNNPQWFNTDKSLKPNPSLKSYKNYDLTRTEASVLAEYPSLVSTDPITAADEAASKAMAESLVESFTQLSTQPELQTKINIYAGTGENAELSNFANRPFKFGGFTYKNVEQAFQHAKWIQFGIPFGLRNNSGLSQTEQAEIKEAINEHVSKILNAATGAEAKKLGNDKTIIPSSFVQELSKGWDNSSSRIMKELLLESFKQNPQALAKLLATGNATLTHTQDKGKWGTEFPRLLMEVRDELRSKQPSTKSKGFQGYKGGFENKGKGTPEGDGKDKAMREVADGFIGELSDLSELPKNSPYDLRNITTKTSTGTSFKAIGTKNSKYSQDYYNEGSTVSSGKLVTTDDMAKVVMLARNKEFSGKPLSNTTKESISNANEDGAEFVVGDMPGVDSQFIDYLQEIGAKFTIYHTGNTPRIQVSTPSVSAESRLTESTSAQTLTTSPQNTPNDSDIVNSLNNLPNEDSECPF